MYRIIRLIEIRQDEKNKDIANVKVKTIILLNSKTTNILVIIKLLNFKLSFF